MTEHRDEADLENRLVNEQAELHLKWPELIDYQFGSAFMRIQQLLANNEMSGRNRSNKMAITYLKQNLW